MYGFILLLNELRGQTKLIEWNVLQAEFRGSLTAILVLKYLVWRSGIEAGARQRVYVIHHQCDIILSKVVE